MKLLKLAAACAFALLPTVSAYATPIHPDMVIQCKELSSTDPRTSHHIFGGGLDLAYTGQALHGREIWAHYNPDGTIRIAAPLTVGAYSFEFMGFEFLEISAYLYRAELKQTNGVPLYGTWESIHTIQCAVR